MNKSIIFQDSHTLSNLDLLIPIGAVFFALQMLFIFFYFGQKVHSDLMALSDMIYQSEWYRYPRSVRRFVLLMMMRAQTPFYLSAYGGIMKCTLANFVRVSNKRNVKTELDHKFIEWDIVSGAELDLFSTHGTAYH